jgi:hypothetical protein
MNALIVLTLSAVLFLLSLPTIHELVSTLRENPASDRPAPQDQGLL